MSETTSRSDHLRASPPLLPISWLDRLTRVHHLVPVVIYVPVVVLLIVLGLGRTSVLGVIGLFVAGYLMWTLAEYWLHRLFFHWQPPGKWGERMHFLVHGVHHKWPRDKYRLVMPPAVSISLYFIFLGSLRAELIPSVVAPICML